MARAWDIYQLLKIGYIKDMDEEDPRILEMMPIIEREVQNAAHRESLINTNLNV